MTKVFLFFLDYGITKMAVFMFLLLLSLYSLLKMDKDSAAVLFPVSSTDPLVVSSHGQSEDKHQTQTKSSTPEHPTYMRTKIRQGQFHCDKNH